MQPNFYRLNNMDDVTLYCSTNNIPSQYFYDFKANPFSVANFAEPKISSKLYISNPANKDVDAIIFYWSDEFNPTFMAVGEISLNNEGVVETDGIVKGFTTELPAGDNKIGKVELVTNAGTIPLPITGNVNLDAQLTTDLSLASKYLASIQGMTNNIKISTNDISINVVSILGLLLNMNTVKGEMISDYVDPTQHAEGSVYFPSQENTVFSKIKTVWADGSLTITYKNIGEDRWNEFWVEAGQIIPLSLPVNTEEIKLIPHGEENIYFNIEVEYKDVN